LQRSYRANGNGDYFSLYENAAWALMQQLHSTLNAPRSITHNNTAPLSAANAAQDNVLLPEQIAAPPA
jgi:hypothetical protein